MSEITSLPNIGKTLAFKLSAIGIHTPEELTEMGSENTIIQLATLEDSGVCINMLYALEGAIQGIRWHGLDQERKLELKDFYDSMIKTR
jgi:DNA transformation protein